MSRRRLFDLLLLGLTLCVAALAFFALRPQEPADQLGSATPGASPTAVPTPTATTIARLLEAVFLGEDSISRDGRGDRPSSAALAGDLLGWDATVRASDGTGFVAAGPTGTATYPNRVVAELAGATAPDIVILLAGTNDRFAEPRELRAAVAETVGRLRETLPLSTRLVLVAPYGSDVREEQARLRVVAGVLKEVAAAERVHFVDPIGDDWLGERADELLAPDGLHLSPEGDEELGRRLAEALLPYDIAPG